MCKRSCGLREVKNKKLAAFLPHSSNSYSMGFLRIAFPQIVNYQPLLPILVSVTPPKCFQTQTLLPCVLIPPSFLYRCSRYSFTFASLLIQIFHRQRLCVSGSQHVARCIQYVRKIFLKQTNDFLRSSF